MGPECRALIDPLSAAAPRLFSEVAAVVDHWLAPLLSRLNGSGQIPTEAKIFNDPIWGSIVLQPPEVLLLDTPLLQRLRGVKQLGMAQLVYLAAGYGRLEHICGVVEGTQRIVNALDISASRAPAPQTAPRRTESDLQALRLAALLHDVGHGPFSHVIEEVIEDHYLDEIGGARAALFAEFADVPKVHPAELLSVLMILSPSMLRVFSHPRFPLLERERLPLVITAAILGSSKFAAAPYLGTVLSGPIDADKLDYMVRDSHHAGLAIGLETTRLLSQLQVAVITEQSAPTNEIRRRVTDHGQPIYELGISRAGVSAYEQMIVSRAILYDRVYYHHKVRTAEAMVRRLIQLAEADRGANLSLSELLLEFSDDTFLCLIGGLVTTGAAQHVSERTKTLAYRILNRSLFQRAFAFATRFVVGLDVNNESATNDTLALLGRKFYRLAHDRNQREEIESEIVERAIRIGESLGGRYAVAKHLVPSDVIVDLPPPDRVSVKGKDLLVCTGGGEIEIPNLYFDPEKWSRAYQSKKLGGFVFTAPEYIPVVNLASKIVFAERFGAAMGPRADRLTKTSRAHPDGVINDLVSEAVISKDIADRLTYKGFHFLRIRADEIELPEAWSTYTDIKERIAAQLSEARPLGYTGSEVTLLLSIVRQLFAFSEIALSGGVLKNVQIGEESKLQKALLSHLRSSGTSACFRRLVIHDSTFG